MSVTLSDELIDPVVVGEKLTAIVHVAPPPANVLVQVVLPPSIA